MTDDLEVTGVKIEFDNVVLSAHFTRPEHVGKWVASTLNDLLDRHPITMATRIVVSRMS